MAIERKNLRSQVRDELLARMRAGLVRPGEGINEVQLAAELGVSRTPLREALIALESEGQITSACPVCGSVSEAHKAFRAIESMGTLGPHAIMAFLERTEQALRMLVDGMDEALLAKRLTDELPSPKELTGHLVDIDAVFRERAWLLLETDRPELPPAHPPRSYRASTTARILQTA